MNKTYFDTSWRAVSGNLLPVVTRLSDQRLCSDWSSCTAVGPTKQREIICSIKNCAHKAEAARIATMKTSVFVVFIWTFHIVWRVSKTIPKMCRKHINPMSRESVSFLVIGARWSVRQPKLLLDKCLPYSGHFFDALYVKNFFLWQKRIAKKNAGNCNRPKKTGTPISLSHKL